VRRFRDAVIDAAAWLRPRVNRQKSSIRHAEEAMPLGFCFSPNGPQVRIRVAPKAMTRLKNRLRT
jgi:hypothetical protein